MKAQVSVEYLIIIGVALGILIPAVFFFYVYNQSNQGSNTNMQLNDIGLQMIGTAKSTYALGTGAWQTLEVNMPDSVTNAYVNGSELVFVYDTTIGPSEAVFYSTINMVSSAPDGSFSAHPGITRYRFISQGQTVLINET